MTTLVSLVSRLLIIVSIGIGARLLVSRFQTIPFTIILVIVGLVISVLPMNLDLPLSHDILFLLFLPPILFAGALRLDYERVRQNVPLIVLLLVVGLPIAIFVMGIGGQYIFSFPIMVSLLLGSMLYPLDPVAVLSVFKEMDVPDRLLAIIESEPLFDDGIAVVFFTTFLQLAHAIQTTNQSLADVLTLGKFISILIDFFVTSLGGLFVGVVLGTITVGLSSYLARDAATDVLLSVFTAYGGMILAEQYLHLSGILAVVAAGIVVGTAGEREILTPESNSHMQSTWEDADLLANTGVYVLIGTYTQIPELINQSRLILLSTILFFIARASIVYILTFIANYWLSDPVPIEHQHILVWGALHTVVPIALALSLPSNLPFSDQLRTIVFGVAIMSIIVQGLSMPYVLKWMNST
jgi:CPA1 family monovalent cation:H+ antiporter